jgi:hypothetical protein
MQIFIDLKKVSKRGQHISYIILIPGIYFFKFNFPPLIRAEWFKSGYLPFLAVRGPFMSWRRVAILSLTTDLTPWSSQKMLGFPRNLNTILRHLQEIWHLNKFSVNLVNYYVSFEVSSSVTMKNAVFWDIKVQFEPHRRHITSPLQSPAA